MFFAESIIFVEGISEQLLVPEFSKYLDLDLTNSHISVINLNGRYFQHFLKLFDTNRSQYAISKKVVCLTDMDPVMKKNENSHWKSCFPFMVGIDESNYEYKESSNELTTQYKSREDSDLIRVYTQKDGSTFEYQLIYENIKCKELLIDSMANKVELKNMMDGYYDDMNEEKLIDLVTKMPKGKFKDSINGFLCKTDNLQPADAAKHIISARYLKSIKKGQAAQELAYIISENRFSKEKNVNTDMDFDFVVPTYINEAIKCICN